MMAALAGAMTLTGCTSDNDTLTTENPNFPADGVMRFASSVENPTTRAGLGDGTNGTTNITGQDLFLWTTPQGEADGSKYIYKSILLHYTTEGGWGTYSSLGSDGSYAPTTLLWKNKTTNVDVVASNFGGSVTSREDLPESTNISTYVYQSSATDVAYSDFLYFKGTVDPSATSDATAEDGTTTYALDNGKIRLPLKHICSKLNITLTLGNEFSMDGAPGREGTNTITDMKVGTMYTKDNFDMKTGAFLKEYKDAFDNNATPKEISPFSAGWTPATSATTKAAATYECILIPQAIAAGNFTVSFKIGEKTYSWTSTDAVTLDSGKQYTLALTAGKDVVQAGSFTTTAWTDGKGGSLETE